MDLPQEYLRRMEALLGEEFPAFLRSYEEKPLSGLRVNTLKLAPEEFRRIAPFHLEPIPWTGNGFYYKEEDHPSHHPYYAAGLYYLQEPSAMAPACILPVRPGDRVLDLCAAPGGKATELAARLQGEGLLVANDVSASRAKALLKNLELSGVVNSFVTTTAAEKLALQFPKFFDSILVDAPCSGEGMFRKDAAAAKAWSPDKVKACAKRQKEIALAAVSMLRPGGFLLYSTCTFAPEEDEQLIAFLIKQCPDMELVQIPMSEGFCAGRPELAGEHADQDLAKCVRIYPHCAAGEGHFLALLRKREQNTFTDTVRSASPRRGSPARISKADRESLMSFLRTVLNVQQGQKMQLDVRGSQVYAVPEASPLSAGVPFLRNGLYLGELKKNRFEPSQALAMALRSSDCKAVFDLEAGDERVYRYLSGETIEAGESEASQNGWQLVCVDGYPLGWGKLSGGMLKNKYHPGWRIQC